MKLIKTIYNKMRNIILTLKLKISAFCNRYNPIAITQMLINVVDDMNQAKYNVRYNTDDIRDLKDTEQLILNDIQAIQLTIKSIREDYESLKTYHNNLSIDYRDNSASHTNLLKLKNELNNRINMIENKKSLLDTPFKDDKLYEVDKETLFINEIEDNNLDNCAKLESRISNLNSICIEYEKLLSSDKNYILKGIAKILVPYEKEDNLQFYKINDIVDDINDVFNEFNNIYNDVNDNNNNINLSK
mgnify:CR=1 FL=1